MDGFTKLGEGATCQAKATAATTAGAHEKVPWRSGESGRSGQRPAEMRPQRCCKNRLCSTESHFIKIFPGCGGPVRGRQGGGHKETSRRQSQTLSQERTVPWTRAVGIGRGGRSARLHFGSADSTRQQTGARGEGREGSWVPGTVDEEPFYG